MVKPDGGPAFPEAVSADSLGGLNYSRFLGMSLRDYFAGQALTGMMANALYLEAQRLHLSALGKFDDTHLLPSLTAQAYLIADAMLAERAK